jgi:hypothetical protein
VIRGSTICFGTKNFPGRLMDDFGRQKQGHDRSE